MSLILSSKEKVPFNSLYWSAIPYFSKTNLQKFKDYVDIYSIEYNINNKTIQGLILEPKNIDKKYPVIIYARGGNNVNPIESDMGTTFKELGAFNLFNYVTKGFVVYTSQYSGYGLNSGVDEFGGKDLNDLLKLKELIDSNPICDDSSINILGVSRGGMMAYLALTKVNWIKKIAVVGGATNLIRNSKERPEMLEKVFIPAFGEKEEELRKRSILFNTDKLQTNAKILLLHGLKDDRVNPLDSIELADKLKQLGINHKLVTYADGDHSISTNRQERDAEIYNWFKSD